MIRALITVLLAFFTSVGTSLITAQEERNWYQVDIVIFSNDDSAALAGEAWPELPQLEYPERSQHLQPGTLMRLPEAPGKLLTIEQASPALPLDLAWEKTIAELWQDYAELLAAEQEPTLAEITVEAAPAVTALHEEEEPPELTIPTPFVLLGEAQRGLRAEQRRLRRSAGRRVLFHESWLQPLRDQQESAPIVISGDDLHGDYPELQGSIQLYVSRYLHIETRLWLNTSGDYLEDNWRIPAPPLPPLASRPAIPRFQVKMPENWWDGNGAILVGEPGNVGEPADYPFGHAIAIEQSRRMRSGELHYIDHPLVGILIMVSVWEFAPWQVSDGDISPAGW